MPGPFTEHVLCVRRDDVFNAGTWHGLAAGGPQVDAARDVIRTQAFFMPRGEVEDDPSYQQIITYAIFRHRGRYLLTRRLKASTEKRLQQLYSLGVGGHVNPGDVGGAGDPVEDGLRREWQEEVVYHGGADVRTLGLLKDDSSPVSKVHLAVVYLVDGDSPEIEIRERDKLSGELLTLDDMRIYYLEMESWSQIVYDRLASEPEPGPDPPRRRLTTR
jgi:predicted NUDIX family phosphoesterase